MTHIGPENPRVATIHNAVKETIRAHLTLVHIGNRRISGRGEW
jgi:hypothetical protein